MELYVLDTNFNAVAIIDDYRSLIWAKRYAQFGDCELYVRACEEYSQILQKGYYLLRNDDDMICRIESIELDTSTEEGDFHIATGKDCRSILNQRVIWQQTNFTGTVENYIRKLITDNIINPVKETRRIDNFILGTFANLRDRISEQVTYSQLGEKIVELCNAYQYGTRIRMDDFNRLVFEVYKGEDRSYNQDVNDHVVFSPDFDNVISSKYITDNSNIKNVALVAGEGEGVDRKRLVCGTAEGLDRYELYVDARDVSSQVEEGETIDYAEMLKTRGIEALAEYGTTVSFEGEVEPNHSYKYGTDYFLGDIVQVVNIYGISARARITEVIETFDENGYSIIPTFEYQLDVISESQKDDFVTEEDVEGKPDSGSDSGDEGGSGSDDEGGTTTEEYDYITNADIDAVFDSL